MEGRSWSCSVCTYKNRSEAFKCQVCDTRKGTSTRKPRVTANFVAQQIASSFPPIPSDIPPPKYQKTNVGRKPLNKSHTSSPGFLINVDRESGVDYDITVDNVTVTFTEYKLLPPEPPAETTEAKNETEIKSEE